MRFITVTELKIHATQVVKEIESTGEEVVVTKRGKPTILMRLVDLKEFSGLSLPPRRKEEKHGKR